MKWLIIAMILASGFALNYSYDGLVYTEPGKTITLPVYVQSISEEGLYTIKCLSNAKIKCPRNFFVSAGKEQSFTVSVTPKLGSNKVSIRFGADLLEFEVIGSNQTDAFFIRLKDYEEAFFRLEKTYGKNQLINDAKLLIKEGHISYNSGDFNALKGITDNLGSILSNYYDTLDPTNLFEKEKASKLNLSVIPLLLLVSLVVVLYKRPKKQSERTYVDELITLVKKEEYEVGKD